jgi:hypothetical protein
MTAPLPVEQRIDRLRKVLVKLHRLGKRTSSYDYLGRRFALKPQAVVHHCKSVESYARRGRL